MKIEDVGERKRRTGKKIIGLALTVVVIICGVGIYDNYSRVGESVPYGDTEEALCLDAISWANLWVTDRVKSPSTAVFPSDSSASCDKVSHGVYIVTSYVDSQNGFGATVRTKWKAEMIDAAKDMKGDNLPHGFFAKEIAFLK